MQRISVVVTASLLLGCVGDIDGPDPGEDAPAVSPTVPGAMTGSASAPAAVAACGPGAAAQVPPARVVRLTRAELANTLADLLGAAAPAALDIENDALVLGYSTGDGRSVSAPYADALRRIAASSAAAFRPQLASGCAASDAAARACVDGFIRDFGKRAFRRPVTDREAGALLAVYDRGADTAATTATGDRLRAGVEWAVRAMMQAPSFVYRTELGDAAARDGATARLGPYEIATLLSYAVMASPPDAELLDAAARGELARTDTLGVQVRRLMAARPERFKERVRRFVAEWLAIDFDSPEWNKSPAVYKAYSTQLRDAFRDELGMSVGDWVSSGASLPRLLTSPDVFVNRASAPIYGLVSTSTSPQRATVDGGRRTGILTQGAFLGTHGHVDASAPIPRGLLIRESLFCIPRPQVPADVPPLPAARPGEARTTRQRFESHIQASGGACVACHAQFNPMGYPFESYDGIGAYRTQENGVAVDTSGAIVGTPHSDREVANASELARALAASADVHECFARQLFRDSTGRGETDYDQCGLSRATRRFTDDALDVRELLVAILTADTYLQRRVSKEQP
jgi:hypothetical protein